MGTWIAELYTDLFFSKELYTDLDQIGSPNHTHGHILLPGKTRITHTYTLSDTLPSPMLTSISAMLLILREL
jgi:hypothetical protein